MPPGDTNLMKGTQARVQGAEDAMQFARKFCPIINRSCVGDSCHCYNEWSWSDNGRGVGYYFAPHCLSPQVSGTLNVYIEGIFNA